MARLWINWLIEMILKYINLYLHKLITKIALWQRYTNSQLFLGEGSKARTYLLACAGHNGFSYE